MYAKLFEQNLIHSKHPASVCYDHDYIDDEEWEWDQSSLSFLEEIDMILPLEHSHLCLTDRYNSKHKN